MEKYDLITIGAGQAGLPLSDAFALAGKRAALIEEKYVGGTCVNAGCAPTKTMIASAEVAYLARRAADFGIHVGEVGVDLEQVRLRKQNIVENFRDRSRCRILESGVNLFYGHASFSGPKSVLVKLHHGEEMQLTSDTIAINTGGRPRLPHLEGLDQVPYLDSTTVMELNELPEHLLILGGGYEALEFGQMFQRFGSQVTILEGGSRLLHREDNDVSEAILQILREDGIDVLLDVHCLKVEMLSKGRISLMVKNPQGERSVTGTHLLIVIGLVPNSDQLNLQTAGVHTDPFGCITTNDRLETNIPGIYALGDVNGGPAFTHIAHSDFRIMRSNLLEGGNATIKDRPVPYTVFIDPQLGRVGLTEHEARAQGVKYRLYRMAMSSVGRAIHLDRKRGFIKALIAEESKQILGAAVLGVDGGELMTMIEIAMLGNLPYTTLRDGIFAHPTLAGFFNQLFAEGNYFTCE
jgi:pyruvate/2-oxoglutarate dehydrogenase complex dihydrolipoamide dehydrogenase (E3) component